MEVHGSRAVDAPELRACATSVAQLATETKLAASTVADLVEACLDVLRGTVPPAAAVLGIGEVHLGRAAVGGADHGHKRGLLAVSAPEGSQVLAVGTDARRATVEAELRRLADLDRVRTATMDMTPPAPSCPPR